ncbi:hypothetical protein LTR10_006533 [Elasticomyces elasticus]|nr:hypothetical protein LTR10_006533 [Elasticomyces elasticus]KAK4973067.1 hypothetical protein LTR42_006361 [Elasticomyces elasticus]
MRGEFSHLFGNDMFSDVVIKFGDRELPGHRTVLSQSLPYFKRLLEYDKAVKTIKLDGQPDAIESMLRYLYGLKEDRSRIKDWRFQLDVIAVATQYKDFAGQINAILRFKMITNAKMDIHTVTDVLRTLPRYRHMHETLREQEKAILETYSLELLNKPEFTSHLNDDPGTKLPELLQDPDFANRFDAQPGRAIAYLVQFGKAFMDLSDKLTEFHTIYPQHFSDITKQATNKPESLEDIVQQPTQVKEEREQLLLPRVEEETKPLRKVKEESKEQLVKVKEEPKGPPAKKRKMQSVVKIEID